MSDEKPINFYGFLVYLIEKKHWGYSALFFTVLPVSSVLVIGLLLWWFLHPRVEVLGGGAVLKIQMNAFSSEIYRMLVHPRGWQYTGISVDAGDTLKVSSSGQITIGADIKGILINSEIAVTYMKNVKNKMKEKGITESEAMEAVKEEMTKANSLSYVTKYSHGWPWTDYKGYSSDLPSHLGKIPSRFSLDENLIDRGYSAGRLLGYVTKERGFLEKLKAKAIKIKSSKIIDFSTNNVTIPDEVENGSKLYLVVNDTDTDVWQYDNFGYFLVTIQRH